MKILKMFLAVNLWVLIGCAYGSNDEIRRAIEKDGYAAISGAFSDTGEGTPFYTRMNFDATEKLDRLKAGFRHKKSSAQDKIYSEIFEKSFFGVPQGGYFYGEIELNDLEIMEKNHEIEKISLQTVFKLSDAEGYNNAQMTALANDPVAPLTGVNVRVAVLDGNIDTNHPGLADLGVEERCYSAGGAGKSSQYPSCLNSSGAQVTVSSGPGTAGGSVHAKFAHGTAVAGLIKTSNAPQCALGAPACPQVKAPSRGVNLIAIRVSGNPISTHDEINSQQASMALQWVIDQNTLGNKIKVVNLSWGNTMIQNASNLQFPYNYSTCDSYILNGSMIPDLADLSGKVQTLYAQGTIVAAASGNNRLQNGTTGTNLPAGMNWPACLSTVTSVSGVGDGETGIGDEGTDITGRTYAKGVHVAEYQVSTMTRVAATGALMTAPWVNYNNTSPPPNYGAPFTVRNFTYTPYQTDVNQTTPYLAQVISGTSFATPLVSGCVAQILERWPTRYRHIPAALAQSTDLTVPIATIYGQPSYQVPQLRCQQALGKVQQETTISPNRSGLSGTWYDASTPGQGFVLDVVPQQPGGMTFFGGWYTFSTTGGATASSQRWYTFQSTSTFNPLGATAPVKIQKSPGGAFMQPIGSSTNVGDGVFKFYNCFDADFSYIMPGEGVPIEKTIKLTRLYPTVRCNENDTMHGQADIAPKQGVETVAPIKKWGLSGSWYQSTSSGNGLIIEVNPAGSTKYRHSSSVVQAREQGAVFVSWFTYRPGGLGGSSYRWFTLQEPIVPDLPPGATPPYPIYPNPYVSAGNKINLDITQTVGGVLGSPGYTQSKVGTGYIEYVNCNRIIFHYSFSAAGEFFGLGDTIELTRVTQPHGSCT